jgi:SAM-dependent methyltransferase
MLPLNPQYWEQRYQIRDTPWDIGSPSPPLRNYTKALEDKDISILIPGAGYAHEAMDLHQRGFTNVFICDWAPSAFIPIKTAFPDFPEQHLLVTDFFELDMCFDLILEQTFFCAINPLQRPNYVKKAADLLGSGGKIAGLLFAQYFDRQGPPFGGTAEEYRALFEPCFHILQLDIAPDSIKPRAERELFFEFENIT